MYFGRFNEILDRREKFNYLQRNIYFAYVNIALVNIL